jgi:hypothetical protein
MVVYSFFSILGDNSCVMLFGSFHACAMYLVWLPLAKTSSFSFLNWIDVNAIVFPTTWCQQSKQKSMREAQMGARSEELTLVA